MQEKGVWKTGCPVSLNRLRLIKFSYYDFNGNEKNDGEMVVLDTVSERVLAIFKKLHSLKFPFSKARRIEIYNGSDDDSIADNNTSCFNYRQITGGGRISLHSYGVAIDINPIQNPYISPQQTTNPHHEVAIISPSAGAGYLNRTNIRPGMAETIVSVFKKNGFSIWGGEWNSCVDWQHFQPSRAAAELFAAMSFKDSKELFEMYVKEQKLLNAIDDISNKFIDLYLENPNEFMQVLRNNSSVLSMSPARAYKIIKSYIYK